MVAGPPPQPVQVQTPPCATISALKWAPNANSLLATSWDGSARIWDVVGGVSTPKSEVKINAPIVCACWSSDGSRYVLGDAAGKVWMLQVGNAQPKQIGEHTSGVSGVYWANENGGLVCTVGYDNKLKYWNGQAPTPLAEVVLDASPVAIYGAAQELFITTAMGNIIWVKLQAPRNIYKVLKPTDVTSQARSMMNPFAGCVSRTDPQIRIVHGCANGRICVKYANGKPPLESPYTFKGIKYKAPDRNSAAKIYPVNCIESHPTYGSTIASGTGCGLVAVWDTMGMDNNMKIERSAPITAVGFSADGSMLAWGEGNDYGKGPQSGQEFPDSKTGIFLVPLNTVIVAAPKPKGK